MLEQDAIYNAYEQRGMQVNRKPGLQIEQLILVLNAMGENGYCMYDLDKFMCQVFPDRIQELKRADKSLMSSKLRSSVESVM